MTRILDEKSSVLLIALTGKSQEFASEVSRVTEHAVKAIEAKGFTFTQTMMDNSEQIARLINEASETATGALEPHACRRPTPPASSRPKAPPTAIARSLKELQDGADAAAKGAATTIAKTLRDLHEQTHAAVEQSKQTASAAVSEMLETHGMLRSDTTALFERLREANILLQEVLSGAHENMSEIESTLVTRVADFVTAMNEVAQKTGIANSAGRAAHQRASSTVTTETLSDLSQLATQFDAHGRSLAEAVALIDRSNRRTEGSLNERGVARDAGRHLDSKAEDVELRISRFSGSLDQSLTAWSPTLDDKAQDLQRASRASPSCSTSRSRAPTTAPARSPAWSRIRPTRARARSPRTSSRSASSNEEEYRAHRAGDARASTIRPPATASRCSTQAAERFAEVVEGLKQMTAEMQRELEATRTELRKGILELPQETAESAAQMRRVIVDQIEALAELNRIVARHGRGLDAVEPAHRARAETPTTPRRAARRRWRTAAPPPAPHARRADIAAAPRRPLRRRAAPRRRRSARPQGGSAGRTGWLSDLLTRASQDEPAAAAARSRRASPRRANRRRRRRRGRRATRSSRSTRSRSTSPA